VADITPQAEGRTISSHQGDVGKEGDLQRLFDEVKQQHGQHPDILVVNAGYGKRVSNILEIDIEEWDYTINVNLRSSFIITKLAVPHMLEQAWGRVIYISSIAAGGTSINGCHYSASKGKSLFVWYFAQALTSSQSWCPRSLEKLGQQDGQERNHIQRCCTCDDHWHWNDPD
jgi:NAD(P)-dependent dehydrogenase (short-subunit alcohol dehydrogenase family)